MTSDGTCLAKERHIAAILKASGWNSEPAPDSNRIEEITRRARIESPTRASTIKSKRYVLSRGIVGASTHQRLIIELRNRDMKP